MRHGVSPICRGAGRVMSGREEEVVGDAIRWSQGRLDQILKAQQPENWSDEAILEVRLAGPFDSLPDTAPQLLEPPAQGGDAAACRLDSGV
jgi:hypothetical protein